MNRLSKLTLALSGSTLLCWIVYGLNPLAAFQLAGEPAGDNLLTYDVAVDCRTLVSSPPRGDAFILNGKLFPAGTLPSGNAVNDPTQPLNGISPIGDWINRGQNGIPFPASIAPSYSSAPAFLATHYYILNDGRALTLEGYASASLVAHLSVTGGIGGFRGAAGEVGGTVLGTNVTGCPNFRAMFSIEPGSMRGTS